MRKPFKVILVLSLSYLAFACSPAATVNKPGTVTNIVAKPTAPPVSSDPAKPGPASDAKLEPFSSDLFKLTFKLPADMKIKVNSAEHFEADNAAITFQLFPWKDARLNEEDVLREGLKGLNNIDKGSFKLDADISGYVQNLGGYYGYVATGTAKHEGIDIYVGMLGLIDPNSAENYISYLTLDKTKNIAADTKNLNVGADVLLSFAKK